MSDEAADGYADAATRRFFAELRDLIAGHAAGSGQARVVLREVDHRRTVAATVSPDFRPGVAEAALFAPDAVRGDRAIVTVLLEPGQGLRDVPPGTLVDYYGVLEPGRAVAIAVGDDVYMPLGPALRRVFFMPKARW